MARLSRLRRIARFAKWPASILALLLAAAWIFSAYRGTQLNTRASVSSLQAGMICAIWGREYLPGSWRGPVPFIHTYEPNAPPDPDDQEFGYHISSTGGYIFLPLWMPLALFAPLAAASWWLGRRRHPPGTCKNCAYDLTGNTSGRCPECGETIARPTT